MRPKGGNPPNIFSVDMMNDTIYMTLKVYKNGSSNIVYLADYLGADVGEIVNITFYRMGDADRKLSKLRKKN